MLFMCPLFMAQITKYENGLLDNTNGPTKKSELIMTLLAIVICIWNPDKRII